MSSSFLPLVLSTAVVFSSLFRPGAAQRCRQTGRGGPQEGAPCVFPFVFRGRTFQECTSAEDPDGRPWCSTRVDENGRHEGGGLGNWGYCERNCVLQGPGRVINFPVFTTDTAKVKTTTIPTTTTTTRPRRRTTRRRTTTMPRLTPTMTTVAAKRPTTNSRPNSFANTATSRPRSSDRGTWLPDPEADQAECGFSTAHKFVLGGTQAKRGEFPFLALLGYRQRSSPGTLVYLCAGTLINRRYVITAAHCTEEDDQVRGVEQVVLGEFDVGGDPDCEDCRPVQRLPVNPRRDVTVHPEWDGSDPLAGADIALIRMSRLARTIFQDINEDILPVCLPWKRGRPLNLRRGQLTVVGWGRISNSDRHSDFSTLGVHQRTVQRLEVPLVPLDRCGGTDYYQRRLGPNVICAGGKQGKDSCSGDSGGPLVAKEEGNGKRTVMFLVGVVSFGSEKCGVGLPGVYTNVEHYMNWILQNLRD